nr:GtrA family protein [Stakelama flava]
MFARLFSLRASGMFARNAVASAGTFAIDLIALWLLVGQLGMQKIPATASAFIGANALHYLLARWWIFPGSERGFIAGYLIFLMNACAGLALILAMFTALNDGLGVYYLIARVIASLSAGILVFCLNATFNFHQL